MGKYRARLAEEQVDIEALSLFEDESDSSLQSELGVNGEDLSSFREAIKASVAMG